jgi:hypothetical protein
MVFLDYRPAPRTILWSELEDSGKTAMTDKGASTDQKSCASKWWIRIRDLLVVTLAGFPEARRAVAEALRNADEGAPGPLLSPT